MSVPTHEQLDAARHEGDASADGVIASLGTDVWAVNALLRGVRRNGDRLPAAVPACVASFFAVDVATPAWLDPERVARAATWSAAHSLHLSAALFCASLPTSYAAARGARVLMATGRMTGADIDRRVNETARFVFDVVAPGALEPDGTAIRGAQKVRLMHAAVRAHVRERAFITDEVAINQEDLLGTLMTFSVVVIRAVRRLGLHVGDRAADDYFHLWRVIGSMLGIHDELLPDDYAEADETFARIAERQFRASEHGRALMELLLARIEAHVRLPGLGFAPRWLVRHLVGDPVADILGVPRTEASRSRFLLVPSFARIGAEALVLKLTPLIGKPLLETAMSIKLKGESPAFAIPTLDDPS